MVLLKIETNYNLKHPIKTFYIPAIVLAICGINWSESSERRNTIMTQNQIAYFKAVAEKNHWDRQDAETARTNRANEVLTGTKIGVDNAHYLRSDFENKRANRARETENYRSNTTQESLRGRELDIKAAETAGYLNRIASQNLVDTYSANKMLAEQLYTDELRRKAGFETLTEKQRLSNVFWDTQAKKELAGKYAMEAEYVPNNAWANMIGAVGSLLRGGSSYNNIGGNYYEQAAKEGKQNKQTLTGQRTWQSAQPGSYGIWETQTGPTGEIFSAGYVLH